jgi:hypothetical protein
VIQIGRSHEFRYTIAVSVISTSDRTRPRTRNGDSRIVALEQPFAAAARVSDSVSALPVSLCRLSAQIGAGSAPEPAQFAVSPSPSQEQALRPMHSRPSCTSVDRLFSDRAGRSNETTS